MGDSVGAAFVAQIIEFCSVTRAAHGPLQVWVASNTFEQNDYLDIQHGGRLAYWTGNVSDPWVIVEETAFVEVRMNCC